MTRTARLFTLVLGMIGVAYSQAPQGPLDDKYGAANQKATYLKNAQLARQQYATCLADPLRANSSVIQVCQLSLNVAAFYEGMAAAVTEEGDVTLPIHRELTLKRKEADRKYESLRSAQLARQQYAACKRNPNASASSCQSYLINAQTYEADAAALPPLPK